MIFPKQTKYIAHISLLVVTLLFSQFLFAASFEVKNVRGDDHLNMRSAPGVGNTVVTKIPANAKNIKYLNKDINVGVTTWSLINWNGSTGWVSKYYLSPSSNIPVTAAPVAIEKKPSITIVEKKPISRLRAVNSRPRPVEKINNKGVWVLRCGNKVPFWKVDVHPKWMKLQQGDYETGLIITAKKQDRNRWNTAIKTIVQGRKGRNQLKLVIKYAYSKRCYDTLTGLRVPYKVVTEFNGETMSGCCRAIKLTNEDATETLQSFVSR